MGIRYEYEAPGFFKHIGIQLVDRITGSETAVEWILDKQAGRRFALDEREIQLIRTLGEQFDFYAALPVKVRKEFIDRTFDTTADAIASRRAGDDGLFEDMHRWNKDDWRLWCNRHLDDVGSNSAQA